MSYSLLFHLWVLQQHQSRSEGHLSLSTPPVSSPCICKEATNVQQLKTPPTVRILPAAWTQWNVLKDSCHRAAALRSFWAGHVDAVFILFNLNQNTSCIFHLHTNKTGYLDWKKYCFSSSLFISFFFTHAVNATQVISVEATISGARLVFRMFALKYLWESIILTRLMWNKQKWNKSNIQTMANQPTEINNAAMRVQTQILTRHITARLSKSVGQGGGNSPWCPYNGKL